MPELWQCAATMPTFNAGLQSGRPLVLDGGLATQLEAAGYDIDGDLWSAKLLQTDPRAIIDAHLAYLEAGAECIISASYQASRLGFARQGLSDAEADRLIVSSVKLACAARDEYLEASPQTGNEPLVAASIGPYGAVLADGSEYTGDYGISKAQLRDFHLPRMELLDRSGAEVLACETIPSVVEAEVLAELLVDAKTPAWISFSCRDRQRISDGSMLRDVCGLFSAHPTVQAVGINCTAPEYIRDLILEAKNGAPAKAIVVYPNSGETYHAADNSWSGEAGVGDFDVSAWRAAGAQLIGGCCRTGPREIALIRSLFQNRTAAGI